PRRLRCLHPHCGVPANVVEDVELCEPLPDVRVLVAADVLRELLEETRLTPRDGAFGAVASAAGGEVADAPLELPGLLAGHRATDRAAAAAAEAGALVGERRVGDGPAAVELADDLRLVRAGIRVEHLAEQRPPCDLAQGANLVDWMVHADGDSRDAHMCGSL